MVVAVVVMLSVPADVKRFSRIKVGDTITARYYENLVVRVKAARRNTCADAMFFMNVKALA